METTVEAPARKWNITPENARMMAAKAHEARKAARHQPEPTPELLQVADQPETVSKESTFVCEQLAHVRGEMRRLQKLAEKLKDPLQLERMHKAIGVLAERERKLAGRPDPGSYKPASSPSGEGGWDSF